VTASLEAGGSAAPTTNLPGGSVLTVGPVQVVEADQRAGQVEEPQQDVGARS
jgi:hypothetical protein